MKALIETRQNRGRQFRTSVCSFALKPPFPPVLIWIWKLSVVSFPDTNYGRSVLIPHLIPSCGPAKDYGHTFRPSLLLLLYKSLADYLIHRRFRYTTAYSFSIAEAVPII